jgi:thioredoxin-related protein
MIKKKYTYILLLSVLLLIPFPAAANDPPASKGIAWLNYDAARMNGENQTQKYFIYFYSQNCGYCRMLEQKTFSNPDVSAYINENFIPVQVDANKETKIAMRYRVQGVPDLRFLAKDGGPIGRWVGFTEADHLLNLLKYVQTDSYQKMSFKEFTKN